MSAEAFDDDDVAMAEPMSTPIGAGHAVTLSLPAVPRFLPSARVVAASMGAEGGLTVDEIDDVRLGVNELVSLLVEGAQPGARITLTMVADDGRVEIDGRLDGDGGSAELDELARRILDAVADDYELDGSSFRLTKVTTVVERH